MELYGNDEQKKETREWLDSAGFVDKYILDENNNPVLAKSFCEWIEWSKKNNKSQRIVAQDHVGKAYISTVFLGFAHGFSDDQEPILWETMVFDDIEKNGYTDSHCERYTFYKEAKEGHNRILEKVKNQYATD